MAGQVTEKYDPEETLTDDIRIIECEFNDEKSPEIQFF